MLLVNIYLYHVTNSNAGTIQQESIYIQCENTT